MKITIIGTGNVALIHGGFLKLKGHEITFLKTSDYNIEHYLELSSKKQYVLNDYTNNDLLISGFDITNNFSEAICNADIILVTTTTLQHDEIARNISPYVKEEQIICLMPSYGSVNIFKKYIKKRIKYVEFETTVYNGRIINSALVNVSFENCRVAAYFTNFSDLEKNNFKKIFFKIDLERNKSLEIALHNPNMIVHTIGVVLSSARIEYSKGEFWLYKEAFTPSIIKVIEKFDIEKNLILKKLGCPELSYFDAAKWRNENDLSVDSLEVFRSFANDASKGPNSLDHRYLKEDVPMGLVMLESIGEILNINTPITTSIIELSSALLDTDFRSLGNRIEKIV